MKESRRIIMTKALLKESLLEILKSKPLPKITIKEICENADVNRSTFYLHYENICDLLEETMQYMIDSFLSYFPVDMELIKLDFSCFELVELNYITEEYLNPYLSFIKENHRIFSTALLNSRVFGFEKIFNRMYANIFEPILQRFNYPVEDRKYVKDILLSLLPVAIVISDARLKALVKDKTTPKTRNEREIAGYRDVLNTIHSS